MYPWQIWINKIICIFKGHQEVEQREIIECKRCWKIIRKKYIPYKETIFEKHHMQ